MERDRGEKTGIDETDIYKYRREIQRYESLGSEDKYFQEKGGIFPNIKKHYEEVRRYELGSVGRITEDICVAIDYVQWFKNTPKFKSQKAIVNGSLVDWGYNSLPEDSTLPIPMSDIPNLYENIAEIFTINASKNEKCFDNLKKMNTVVFNMDRGFLLNFRTNSKNIESMNIIVLYDYDVVGQHTLTMEDMKNLNTKQQESLEKVSEIARDTAKSAFNDNALDPSDYG